MLLQDLIRQKLAHSLLEKRLFSQVILLEIDFLTINIEDNIFGENHKEKTSKRRIRIVCNKRLGFRKLYDRGDFPISVNHDAKGNKINWKARNRFAYY